jgi:hypothetical protein
MTSEELKFLTEKYNIFGKIAEREIVNTGAQLKDVDYDSFEILCNFRKILNSPIIFLFNGITTGKHLSIGHKEGKAFDVAIPNLTSSKVFTSAIDAGFRRVGVYWNGSVHSYHLENGKTGFWRGIKNSGEDWQYLSIL